VPLTTNGIAPYTSDDVFYKDYRIPKNTVVMINLWVLSYDESRGEKPTEFHLERYMNDTESKYHKRKPPHPSLRTKKVYMGGQDGGYV
jgi:cytochrome P450